MAKKPKEVPQPEPLEAESLKEDSASDKPKASARIDKERVNVFSPTGAFARQYSFSVHGKEFVDKAKEYASKIKGRYEFPILL